MELRGSISTLKFQHRLLTAMLMLFVHSHLEAASFHDFYHTFTNNAVVMTMLVDSEETAWIGTSNGLMRYEDLKRPDDIRMAMPEELRVPINQIQAIKDGRILVDTRSTKKYIFDPLTYEVKEINQDWLNARGIANDGPWTIKIVSHPEANALIESKGSIYSVDLTSDSKAKLIKKFGQPTLALSADKNHYHILTPRKVYTYAFDTKKISEITTPEETFAPKVLKDNKGNIWVGDKNLYHYDIKTGKWQKLRSDLMVTEIERSGSDIYVGTSKSGIIHYNDAGEIQEELHHNPFDINTPLSDHCELIYVDDKDNLWVAYNKNDLSISSQSYQSTTPRHIQSLQSKFIKDDVISILPISDTEMLAGTDGNGLHLINPETGKEIKDLSTDISTIGDASITALFRDSCNRLWIGIYRQGLICLDNGKQHNFLHNTSPFSIVEDSDGNIFVGTSGNGLYRIDRQLDKEPYKIDLQGESWIQKISVDKSGLLYITTEYLDLMERYGNPGIFQALVAGEDALSLDHANASIPWSHGSARCYEVTGNPYWKQVTENFWHCAVDDRESYATGGQNAGEFWIPKGQLANFAGENNQEHCTVYNMMRTADFLYRWTGDPVYADYFERNLYNGVLAQQNPYTGMIAYFLPMAAGYKKGGEKGWGSETMDFFCCHGSLVQAQVRYLEDIYFDNKDGLVVSQYIPSTLDWGKDGKKVKFSQDFLANQWNKEFDVPRFKMEMKVQAEEPAEFALQLRLPWWLAEKAKISVNGEPQKVASLHGMHTIRRTWGKDDTVMVEFPQRLWVEALPGSDKVAFMEGPIVLAGICDHEVTLDAGKNDPSKLLRPEYHQKYVGTHWTQSHYQTTGQPQNIRFVPLYEIADENYTVYFPIKK